jgi:hypothetical protein
MRRQKLLVFLVIVGLLASAACETEPGREASAGEAVGCSHLGRAVPSGDGSTRIAFLVGVSDYKSAEIRDLRGPAADVLAIHRLLTDPKGYAFPPENVCALVDGEATVAQFRDRFQKSLVDRAKDAKGQGKVIAFFFYAGHGSQASDHNGDENDGMDETLVLHDSRSGKVDDLRDDELNGLLGSLYEHTKDITVALDSCNSGSATRAAPVGDADMVERLLPPRPDDAEYAGRDTGEGVDEWTPESMPGLTMLSGAKDGSSALEPTAGGHGYFTEAFLKVLTDVGARSLTWGQVARRMPILISASTRQRQHPVFQGDRNKYVFDATERARPMGWEVVAAGDPIKLGGFALPGWGKDAHVRIFPGDSQSTDVKDPAKAKATLTLTSYDGTSAQGAIVGAVTSPIEPGDIAVLVLPGPDAITLPVRLVTGADPEALGAEQVDELKRALAERPEVSGIVKLTTAADAFLVGVDKDNRYRIRGPEGVIRNPNPFETPGKVVESLAQHARQRALLQLEGEPGTEFVNDQTLEVSLEPVNVDVNTCSQQAFKKWVQACPNEEQVIPLCATWRIKVKNTGDKDLLVGGAILWNDGGMFGLPNDGESLRLGAGKSDTLDLSRTFTSGPPLDAVEHIVVFGTKETNPIDWSVVTEPAVRSARGRPMSPLEKVLSQYTTGTRGGIENVVAATETWTSSKVPIRVLANAQFEDLTPTQQVCDKGEKLIQEREFTVHDFDLSPYLPANDNYLRKILERGWFLADKANPDSAGDGIPYVQHPWDKGSGNALETDDAANLAAGIDCSRSIWYVFTRSGLQYASRDWHRGYLSTAEMFDAPKGSCLPETTPQSSLLHENFESCLGQPYQTGDVLVWQGVRPTNGKCVGHTVMVIDPQKFVGWGSHGWDANEEAHNDTGVEYQRILGGDWAKWDRRQYSLKACWRHKEFIKEAKVPGGRPGDAPLADPCKPGVCVS